MSKTFSIGGRIAVNRLGFGAMQITGPGVWGPPRDRAEALRRWLLEIWQEKQVLVRDVVRLGPSPLRESPKARAALGILEKHGWLVKLEAGTVVRGAARAEAWSIVKEVCNVV